MEQIFIQLAIEIVGGLSVVVIVGVAGVAIVWLRRLRD
jgi:hypothetical protein